MSATDADDLDAERRTSAARLGPRRARPHAHRSAGAISRLSRLLRELVHPHRGAARADPHLRRGAHQRQRTARPARPRRARCPSSRCRRTRWCSCWAAAIARPIVCPRSPGISSATAPTGLARVQAICDFVHNHIKFGYEYARPTKTAWDVFNEKAGVCRDFAHLAITLCRCMNIPARYCTGYLGDIGVPPRRRAHGFRGLVRGLPRTVPGTRSTRATTRPASGGS